MKKILLIFDSTNFSESIFQFAKRLNQLQPVLVIGVFVPQVSYSNLWSYAAAGAAGVYIPLLEEDESKMIEKNVQHFEELCKTNRISYGIHKDFYDFALPELKEETRFADVVIISGESFFNNTLATEQFEFLRDALHAAECPVLVVPENYTFPTSNILAYDGSDESVYAIKQFAYLFPELAKNTTLLVYAEDKTDRDFPSREYIMELAARHFNDLTFYKLEANPKRYFASWINGKKASLLVSGSFSRSAFSQAFKKSFVSDIIREHKVPVFVAHK